MCAYHLYFFSQKMLTGKVSTRLEFEILWNDFLFFCDVFGVTYNLDFTRQNRRACLGLKVEKFSYYSKVGLGAFSWVWDHHTCKCVEDMDITPWTQLSMVLLNMTLIALGITYKNSLSTYLTQAYVHGNECLLASWVLLKSY